MVEVFLLMQLAGDPAPVLIANLGSDIYVVRVTAHQELVRRCDLDLYFRLHANQGRNLEAKRRIESIKVAWHDRLRSQYKADLKGYPAHPWIIANGQTSHQKYLYLAWSQGICRDNHPNWSDWRMAGEIFINQKIDAELCRALCQAKDQQDFCRIMDEAMAIIQQDVDAMLKDEDRWWGGADKNPLKKK